MNSAYPHYTTRSVNHPTPPPASCDFYAAILLNFLSKTPQETSKLDVREMSHKSLFWNPFFAFIREGVVIPWHRLKKWSVFTPKNPRYQDLVSPI